MQYAWHTPYMRSKLWEENRNTKACTGGYSTTFLKEIMLQDVNWIRLRIAYGGGHVARRQ